MKLMFDFRNRLTNTGNCQFCAFLDRPRCKFKQIIENNKASVCFDFTKKFKRLRYI
ncbi:hypothetical protein LCGC14_1846310 [marine sediment metagenome]|uniref:Uncharacterized protein n=1 Tax=marine sediment metagenome TaxID=412755 RepID=A0A0F9GBP6_9ZZZZ